MAFNQDAIYRVRGQVTGTRDVQELADAMGRVGPAAARSASGVRQLGSRAREASQDTIALSNALTSLTTLGVALQLDRITSGLTRMIGETLEVGEQSMMLDMRLKNVTGSLNKYAQAQALARDAAQRFGLSQMDAENAVARLNARLLPLGKSTQLIENTFYGVIQAGRAMGQTADDINAAFLQVGQMLSSANAQWDEMKILMDRIPQLGAAMIKAFNQIREDKGLVLITKEEAQEQEKIIKDNAKRQTETLQDTIRDQKTLLERQTEDSTREINKRYKDHERELKASIERQERQIQNKYNRELEALRQNLEDQRRVRDNQTSDQEDTERQKIRDKYDKQRLADQRYREDFDSKNQAYLDSLSEDEKKAIQRRIEDERREYDKKLAEREDKELKAFDRTAETMRIRQERADKREEEKLAANITTKQKKEEDALKRTEEIKMQALNDSQAKELRKVEEARDKQLALLQRRLAEETKLIETATKNQLAQVLASTKVTYNDLKDLVTKGLIKPDVLEKTMEILRRDTAKAVPPPGPLQAFNAALADLNKEIGENLLPKLTPLIENLTKLIRAFNSLPDPVKAAVGVLGTAVAVVGTLAAGLLLAVGSALALVGAFRQLAGMSPLRLPTLGLGRSPASPPPGAAPPAAPRPGPVQPWAARPQGGPVQPWNAPTGPQPSRNMLPQGGPVQPWNHTYVPPRQAPSPMTPQPWRAPAGPPPAPPGLPTAGDAGKIVQIGGAARTVWGVVVGLVRNLAALFSGPLTQGLARFGGALAGLRVGATVAGWLGAAGPAVAGIQGALTGLGAWITGTFLPGLAAFFSGPIGWAVIGAALIGAAIIWREPLTNFLAWIDKTFMKDVVNFFSGPLGWVLIGNPLISKVIEWRKPIMGFFEWLGGEFMNKSALAAPMVEGWARSTATALAGMKNNVDYELNAIGEMFVLLEQDAIKAWEGITKGLDDFNKQANELLDSFQKFVNEKWEGIKQGLSNAIGGMIEGAQKSLRNLASNLTGPFEAAASTIKNVLNSIIGAAEWAINRSVDGANMIANGINAISRKSPIPIALVPTLGYAKLPRLARGGWFDRATIAEIGEGGDPGGEYAIPASKMPAAMAAWNSGARGEALVRQMQTGLVPGSSLGASSGGGGGAPQRVLNMPITVQTAYVLPDGTETVSMDDVIAIAQQVHRAAVGDAVAASIRVVTSPQMRPRIR